MRRLRPRGPDIGLTTDIIVGFPGETEAQFEQTLSLVRTRCATIRRTRSSIRPAWVPGGLHARRHARRGEVPGIQTLIAKQQAIRPRSSRAHGRNHREVLVESVSARDAGWVGGKSPRALMVNFPGGEELIGRIVKVRDHLRGAATPCAESL